jgi:hypothetical protein
LDPKSAQGEQILLAMEELYLTKLLEQDKNPFVLKDEAITLRQNVVDQICLLHDHGERQGDAVLRTSLDSNPTLRDLCTNVANSVEGLAGNQHALYTAAGRSATNATQTNEPSIVDFLQKIGTERQTAR